MIKQIEILLFFILFVFSFEKDNHFNFSFFFQLSIVEDFYLEVCQQKLLGGSRQSIIQIPSSPLSGTSYNTS